MTHFYQFLVVPFSCALWAACGPATQSADVDRRPIESKPVEIKFHLSTEGPPTSLLVDELAGDEQPGWLRLYRDGAPVLLNRRCATVPACPPATFGSCPKPVEHVWSAATTNAIAFTWDGRGWVEKQAASGTCATFKTLDLSGEWEVEFCVRVDDASPVCNRKQFDPRADTFVEHKMAKTPLPSCEGKPWGSYGGRLEDEPMMSALAEFYSLRGEPVTSIHADEFGPNRKVDVRINFSSENVVVHRLTPYRDNGRWLFDIDWACQLVGGEHGGTL